MGVRTVSEIEAMAQADTPTAREIVQFFLKNGNQPADYTGLMHLASGGALSGAVQRLLDDGILEYVHYPDRALTKVRLKDFR